VTRNLGACYVSSKAVSSDVRSRKFHAMQLPRLAILILCLSHAVSAFADIRADVKGIFAQDMTSLDLARTKFQIDRLVDRSTDIDPQLAEIDLMAATIQGMLPPGADDWAKIDAIRQFIYQPGPWNDNRAFLYDHNDPYGNDLTNKLLSDYIADRQGNCVTMPILFIILGQRLGLDVTAAVAPLHVLVKFTDSTGATWNLEATSGAGKARDQHYRDLLPISDRALQTGIYLKPLTKEETVGVMAMLVLEDLIEKKRYLDAMAVADIILDHDPLSTHAMVKKATAAYYMLKADFYDKYPTAQDVPEDQRPLLAYLQRINDDMFQNAENLGWQPFNP
jgi:regulator of sirC expression with transglutaminase-like and TPR domain